MTIPADAVGKRTSKFPRAYECFSDEKSPGCKGFSDEMFDKAAAVNSDAQLYKQAGNGVTIPVVYAVGKRIVEIQNELNKEGI